MSEENKKSKYEVYTDKLKDTPEYKDGVIELQKDEITALRSELERAKTRHEKEISHTLDRLQSAHEELAQLKAEQEKFNRVFETKTYKEYDKQMVENEKFRKDQWKRDKLQCDLIRDLENELAQLKAAQPIITADSIVWRTEDWRVTIFFDSVDINLVEGPTMHAWHEVNEIPEEVAQLLEITPPQTEQRLVGLTLDDIERMEPKEYETEQEEET